MIGLLEPMKKSMVPLQVQLSMPVVKVASGESGFSLWAGVGEPSSGSGPALGLISKPGIPCVLLTLRKRPLGDADS